MQGCSLGYVRLESAKVGERDADDAEDEEAEGAEHSYIGQLGDGL